jgi:hypothetical protein
MSMFLSLIAFAGCIAFVVWLSRGSSPTKANPTTGAAPPDDAAFIDSSDPRQIGQLIGMTGGSLQDAVVARFALQRFEQIHGRKATNRDIGLLVGMLQSADWQELVKIPRKPT